MSVLSKINWKRVLRPSLATFLACNLFLTGCAGASQGKIDRNPTQTYSLPSSSPRLPQRAGTVTEVSPPETLQALNQVLDRYQPQVKILTPKAGAVIESDQVSVELQVKDLPIFKDAKLDLGSHLDVVLDNQPSQSVYDLSSPLIFKNLEPGTHTLRVFASRPWHESFKNEGAYAQVTFHLFTPSNQNNPSSALPILTYNSPSGRYGAEPILLDFYLSNAPLKLQPDLGSGAGAANSVGQDWQIRCTINGQSFVLDRWQPLYLTGFHPGQNWVRLELINAQGQAIDNLFNDTVQVIDYQPNGQDTLSKLVRGDLKLSRAKTMILPGYKAVQLPEPEPEPEPESEPESAVDQAPWERGTPAIPAIEPTPITEVPTKSESTPATTSPLAADSKAETSSPATVTVEATEAGGSEDAQASTTSTETTVSPVPQKRGWGRFFSRKATNFNSPGSPNPAVTPAASILPEVSEGDTAAETDEATATSETKPDVTSEAASEATFEATPAASAEAEDVPAAIATPSITPDSSAAAPSNPEKSGWAKFFARKSQPAATPSPTPQTEFATPDVPPAEVVSPSPSPVGETSPTLTPASEVTPAVSAPETPAAEVAPTKSWQGFKRLVRRKPSATATPTTEPAPTPDSPESLTLEPGDASGSETSPEPISATVRN